MALTETMADVREQKRVRFLKRHDDCTCERETRQLNTFCMIVLNN